jgi:hypothetical protein
MPGYCPEENIQHNLAFFIKFTNDRDIRNNTDNIRIPAPQILVSNCHQHKILEAVIYATCALPTLTSQQNGRLSVGYKRSDTRQNNKCKQYSQDFSTNFIRWNKTTYHTNQNKSQHCIYITTNSMTLCSNGTTRYLAEFFSQLKMLHTNVVEKTIFTSKKLFSKILPLWHYLGKYCRAWQTTEGHRAHEYCITGTQR